MVDGTASGSLLVCKKFKLEYDHIRSAEQLKPCWYVRPMYRIEYDKLDSVEDQDNFRVYKPFESSPNLFREFASLHIGDRSEEVALAWAHTHAPLTCHLAIGLNRHGYVHTSLNSRDHVYGFNDPRDYVDEFFEEVDRAATVLGLYEAVLRGDGQAAEDLVQEGPSPFARELYQGLWDSEKYDKYYDGILGFALQAVAFEVTRMVRTFAHRAFYLPAGRALASRMKWGWEFDNLLGALYLQMYWLLEAGEKNIAHCKWCGSLIKLTTQKPSSKNPSNIRKTRQDRQFCDNDGKCQRSYYYHTNVKPKREAKHQKQRSYHQGKEAEGGQAGQ